MWHPIKCDVNERLWHIPVISIGATVIGGAIIIVAIRGISWLNKKIKRFHHSATTQENLIQTGFADIERQNAGYLTKLQDWAANFISSNSKFGSILV